MSRHPRLTKITFWAYFLILLPAMGFPANFGIRSAEHGRWLLATAELSLAFSALAAGVWWKTRPENLYD